MLDDDMGHSVRGETQIADSGAEDGNDGQTTGGCKVHYAGVVGNEQRTSIKDARRFLNRRGTSFVLNSHA